jgi:TetR/AcrR family transcriptional regulator, transcriptional repressor for nem operon
LLILKRYIIFAYRTFSIYFMTETREYIIEEAFKLFLSRSYEAVSINDISQAIGLTKGALYHHFKNKEELFKAVIDKYLTISSFAEEVENISLRQYIELNVSLAEKTISQLFSHSSNFDPINYMSLFVDSFRHYIGFAEEKTSFFLKEIEKVKIILENSIKRGEIRSDINTSLMASTFFSITIGLATNIMKNEPVKITIRQLRNQLIQLYNLLKL